MYTVNINPIVRPSQLLDTPARVSGAAVGGAIAALLILAVFAATVKTILIVVLVRRRRVHKSTTCTCTLKPCVLDEEQVLEQSAEEMELQQNSCYALSGSYKQGDQEIDIE